jgi:hypothetical protein
MVRWLGIPVFFFAGAYSVLSFAHMPGSFSEYVLDHHLKVPAGQKLMGNLETVWGAHPGALLRLSGWCAFTSTTEHVARLVISIDDKQVARVNGFFDRPDVADAYGRPDLELSGWRTEVLLGTINKGAHRLRVVAVADNGESAEMPEVTFNVE